MLKRRIGEHVDTVNLEFARRKKREDLLPVG